jgi:hypothetical protein
LEEYKNARFYEMFKIAGDIFREVMKMKTVYTKTDYISRLGKRSGQCLIVGGS